MDGLEPLLEWIRQHPHWAGFALFLIALTESLAAVGLFVPGAALMFGAGTLIAGGHMSLGSSIAWAIAGAVLGDSLSYWLGSHYGARLAGRWPFSRYPRLLVRSERFFERHGGKSVLLGRFVGPIRPVIPAVAGMAGMPRGRFLLVNVLSALVWAPAYLLPGAVFAASLSLAAEVAARLLALLAAAALAGWLGVLAFSALHSGLRRTALARYLGQRRGLWLGLAAVLICVPLLTLAAYTWQLRQPLPPRLLTPAEWAGQVLPSLPERRLALVDEKDRFAFYWAAEEQRLAARLVAAGWLPGRKFDLHGMLRWLSPNPQPEVLPPLPRWHRAQLPRHVFVRPVAGMEHQRWVMELWRSPVRVDGLGPVWQGRLVREHLRPGWPLSWQEADTVEPWPLLENVKGLRLGDEQPIPRLWFAPPPSL
ncbi:DedA family protein [Alkalilimnicola sp. S0819]|uniref:DedA family protein n=1 Tax=Alkalilimnicola sp. S0819 TaxID=2613922 RepID=UPI0012625167|nr:DedA family protein [Alkalilimnicola sp. S0819]KAB7623019.1 DedA family protein [Alkalilimnicola sp. S0819]MPQ17131.1 hypothetical protein [Alkalilimnicola sp. S0819]